uniref:Uncharacterized protein n=1 Tax=Cacopsylla melanoneura TaxID=428564 RepID=A0A8D9FB72_9HEMI
MCPLEKIVLEYIPLACPVDMLQIMILRLFQLRFCKTYHEGIVFRCVFRNSDPIFLLNNILNLLMKPKVFVGRLSKIFKTTPKQQKCIYYSVQFFNLHIYIMVFLY